MYRFDVTKLSQFIRFSPGCEFPYSPGISLTGIGIADICGKKLDEAFTCVRIGCEQCRQRRHIFRGDEKIVVHESASQQRDAELASNSAQFLIKCGQGEPQALGQFQISGIVKSEPATFGQAQRRRPSKGIGI